MGSATLARGTPPLGILTVQRRRQMESNEELHMSICSYKLAVLGKEKDSQTASTRGTAYTENERRDC